MKRKWLRYGALTCALALVLSACGSSRPSSQSQAQSQRPDARELRLENSQRPSDKDPRLSGIAFGNGRFVVLGVTATKPRYHRAWVSTDGEHWTEHQIGELSEVRGMPLSSIAFGNGVFVVSGQGKIATSTDGENWTVGEDLPIGTWKITGLDGPDAVEYAPTKLRFIDGGFYRLTNRLDRSVDGVNWDLNLTIRAGDEERYTLDDITEFGGDLWAVSGYEIWRSRDGGDRFEMVLAPAIGDAFQGIYANDDGIYAANWAGELFRSADGANWHYSLPAPNFLRYEVVNGMHFLSAWGEQGETYELYTLVSPDGEDWGLIVSDDLAVGVAYSNGTWVVVGGDGQVLRSHDGENWQQGWLGFAE